MAMGPVPQKTLNWLYNVLTGVSTLKYAIESYEPLTGYRSIMMSTEPTPTSPKPYSKIPTFPLGQMCTVRWCKGIEECRINAHNADVV